ncbi:periplasmic solute-binding protein [Pseudoxanthomonas spadix BD-a59]|uniref:Endolytic murein transglycosylase n=1 Tax=Pseudoxanthomonas spadix (strain BD-a59) TaxID=1045855 RepID=G7UQG5_PSEUP|nr:endolytic transglycosylase MltG [Pseudoxanthomonas spadix]AER56968.1 periplasmic solute-binding protein [Pseudoxanthomonas spadix BD-a59]
MASGCRRALRAIVLVGVLLVLAVAAVALWGWQRYQGFQSAPLPGLHTGQVVQVKQGDSFRAVLARLRAQGINAGTDLEWQLLARQLDAAGKLKVGEYALDPGTTPRTLLQNMRAGRIIQYRFTIVEGWNFRQLRAALDAATPLLHQTRQLDDAALMAAIGHAGQHPEGRFLPETYLYVRGDSDLDVLKRAYEAMARALAAAWAERAADLPLTTPDQALILASIVEKETGIAEERAQIAGVFVRRLRLGMKLQTDPTVIYGIGSAYDGNIRRRDLATDTPYNTYTRSGLTPTPIAMPGRDALQAALHPAPGDALYFVALGDGSGRHVFSATLAQHNAAVRQYLDRMRRPPLPEEQAALAPADAQAGPAPDARIGPR